MDILYCAKSCSVATPALLVTSHSRCQPIEMGRVSAALLSPPSIAECLSLLPCVALRKGGFVDYPALNMKLAPRWPDIIPYTKTLRQLLIASGGKQIRQSSMLAGAKFFSDRALCERGRRTEPMQTQTRN